MNAGTIESSLNLLRLVRMSTDAIGVAVSFGKDSLAVLDLCCQVFRRVEGYYLYRVRGLRIVDEWAEAVEQRHGVSVRMYPHFDLSRCYKNAVLQPHWKETAKTPRVKMADIESRFRNEANVDWIAYGWRKNDSFARAIILKQCRGFDDKGRRVFPIRMWRRGDVYEYLQQRGIPLPSGLGRKDQGGLDFHPAALAELREKYPDDWAKWVRDFPFAGLQLANGIVPTFHDTEPAASAEQDSTAASNTAPPRTDQLDRQAKPRRQAARRRAGSRKEGLPA